MSNEIAKPNPFEITTFAEAEKLANMIANSSLCPPGFKGKSGDVFVAIQMGHEVGLSPMQAIQNIAVINSRPCLWGDAALGVVRNHKHCKAVREWMEGTIEEKNAVAYCGVTRQGQPEEIRSFSYAQAETAGLTKKAGVWTQYPHRMLQMRARGFAIRDTFPDALRGLNLAEEQQDIVDVTYEVVQQVEKAKQLEGIPLSQTASTDPEVLQKHLDKIHNASDMDILKIAYADALKAVKGDREASNAVSKAKNERKSSLTEQSKLATERYKNSTVRENVDEFYKEYDNAEGKQ